MPHPSGVQLADLSFDDLDVLRLAAQVMAHRAQLAGRPRVELYFQSLESATLAEQAARSQAGVGSASRAGVIGPPGLDDRRLIHEYLGLLADNQRLSLTVRSHCRDLASGFSLGGES